jgi:rubrerythrin
VEADRLLNQLIEVEKEQQRIYASRLKIETNIGMKQLLTSLIEQEKDHERRLTDLSEAAAPETLFDSRKLARFSLSSYSKTQKYSESLNVNDMLNLIIEEEEIASRLYSDISAMCRDDERGFVFTSLAFEENKHKNWAMDRYELEMLSGFSDS